MKNGFIKVAAATPHIQIADPAHNAGELIRLLKEADAKGAKLAVFPELCLSGCTAGDLFYQNRLLNGVLDGLSDFLKATAEIETVAVIGIPLAVGARLYNCVAVCQQGKVLGIVPKTETMSRGEVPYSRWFASAEDAGKTIAAISPFGEVPFGTDLIFTCREVSDFRFACELGEDAQAAVPPSARHTAAGATIICCSAASTETVGKSKYRRRTIATRSADNNAGYLYASAGAGESTTDLVFGGHCMIYENGTMLAEKAPFASNDLVYTELDVERLAYERRRANRAKTSAPYRVIEFSLTVSETTLTRPVSAHPFLPDEDTARAARCEEILSIQSAGLAQRVVRAYAKKLVIGISGGLDSTLALLVMVRAIDALERPRKDILAVTMPCFGTTKRTKSNATVLCEELGVDFRCVDIFDAVKVHFRDIGHDPDVRNVTYENSQARERTQVLMDIANDCGGMVIGTGDLSELALGWATYNGDHMSMYGVNGAIPKTLVRHLVAHCADGYERDGRQAVADALRDVLNTPVSPELLPADADGNIAQKTEDLVGPYELHDFYLFYLLRYGYAPDKLYRLAKYAFKDAYKDATLLHWLSTLLRRFFNQQFKRSCLPDGPKVGSVGLSPRGDWQMPSDASSALWLCEVENLKSK